VHVVNVTFIEGVGIVSSVHVVHQSPAVRVEVSR
jgi:hypothetical protein